MISNIKILGEEIPHLCIADTIEELMEYSQSHPDNLVIRRIDNRSDEWHVKMVLMPTLFKMMPGINWFKMLGIESMTVEAWTAYKSKTNIIGGGASSVEMSLSENGNFVSTGSDALGEFLDDYEHCVSIDKLRQFDLLPKFLSEIYDACADTVDDYEFVEGYNKKVGGAIGLYRNASNARNLLIIDVSYSIPAKVAATLLILADQMRRDAHAALIVTGATSMFWDENDTLPSPEQMRATIARSNESAAFNRILRKYIAGEHWGNVIVFGDSDTPRIETETLADLTQGNTKVDRLMGFWIGYDEEIPGYGRWVNLVNMRNNQTNSDPTRFCNFAYNVYNQEERDETIDITIDTEWTSIVIEDEDW